MTDPASAQPSPVDLMIVDTIVVTMDAERSFPNVESLLGAADQALYKAKAEGRNRCVKA